MHIINRHLSIIKVAVLLLIVSSCTVIDSVEEIGSEEFTLWNKIITINFFQSIVGNGEFTANLEDEKVLYIFVYEPPASAPDYLLSAAVEVRSAGTLLNRAEHEHVVATTPLNERAGRFPLVGARAQTTTPFFGPGGSSFGLLSTTIDELYDIKVNVVQSGAEGDLPTLDALDISARIHQAYQERDLFTSLRGFQLHSSVVTGPATVDTSKSLI
ncbi:MAG: hypothetical protein GY737_24105 [Desulfobacteraceae bacterium]|nr:hypothetical protein [Desulfobacteraceae bacterium]